MPTRISMYKDFEVSDRVKVRVKDLKLRDFFQHMGTIYRVTDVSNRNLFFMEICQHSYPHKFGRNSQQFVYKVLLS
jgi:hypothetical protein